MANKIKVEDLKPADFPKIVWLYCCRNKLSLTLLVICVVSGMSRFFGLSGLSPWKNWEIAALGFTLIYTGFIYWSGFQKKYFEDVGGRVTAMVVTALLSLVFVFLLSGNEFFHIFNFSVGRRYNMLFLLATTVLFVALDFMLFKALATHKPAVSKAYFLSLKFSDVPILIAFSFLSLYAFSLGEKDIINKHMDAFFGGTIAFQMMLSNIIWTLTDDVFIDHPDANHLTQNHN